MKYLSCLLLVTLLNSQHVKAQENVFEPDLAKANDEKVWTLYDRDASFDNGLYLDGRLSDGLLWLNDFEFENGTIELEIKGKDVQGQSFVGVAFHIENDSTYDAVYFRAFNFKNPDRNNHSVQYISHPDYPWHRLREESPGKYENTVIPVPDPSDWFKARIEINYPVVKVFVNDSEEASLEVQQISKRAKGGVGLWVGYSSEGAFRKMKITKN